MSQKIYVGVDGGASKCEVRIEDEAGNLLAQDIGGPANIRISIPKAWQNIIATLNNALKKANIELTDDNYEFHVGLGLAGTESQSAVDEFLTQPHPFATIRLESDCYTACIGAHNGKNGGMIIIGTGVAGLRMQNKKVVHVGGWGFPYDDDGSGAWLGLEAIRLTFQAHDGRIDPSPLLRAIKKKFDNDLMRLLNWANNAKSIQFAQLTPLIFKYLEKRDSWAVHLIKRAANEIDRIFYALEKSAKNKKEKLPYSLYGGVTQAIRPWLCGHLRARIVSRQHDATKGAILMIKKDL